MSWELASFIILGAVLLAGFAWYERSRPPAQVVAMVAVLAALAIAGRVAFAAFPNVKPTTDIVVFAGYALGPAGGFAVGGLTALVSNIWFGQGPWTPWQMAGWGMCGLIGAALALGGRNVGRFTLAAVCGFAGVLYGALLNFSLMATYGGDLSLEHFLVLESRAIPFDAAHAIGNVVFALIAGPAMIRMLIRFRERFEWRAPAATASLLLVLALLSVVVPSGAAASSAQGANWLESVQNADGGFGGSPGDESSPGTTAWAMMGLAAADRNPFDVERSGNSPVDYLRTQIGANESAGALARTILALQSTGVDPRNFAGRNLVAALLNRRRSDGSYGKGQGWPGTTAYAVVALRAAGAGDGLDRSIAWLASAQNDDYGWGDVIDIPSNADVTGSVMQAMPSSKAGQSGARYLRTHNRGDGGWPLAGSGPSNSQSTAWAVQGLIAVGSEAGSGLDYLASVQAADGHYRYSANSDSTPVFVTAQVLVPASGNSLPIPVPAREPQPAPTTSPTTPISPANPTTPVPIPGVDSLPSNSPSGATPELASPGGGGTSSGGSGPLVPEVSAGGPSTALPPGTEPEEPGALTEAAPASAVDGATDGTSPWVPIGIALGLTALAVAVPWVLGRRFAW